MEDDVFIIINIGEIEPMSLFFHILHVCGNKLIPTPNEPSNPRILIISSSLIYKYIK